MRQLRQAGGRRPSLLTQFAVISFVLIAGAGVVLGNRLGTIQEERSRDDAVERAEIVADATAKRVLRVDELQNGFQRLPDSRLVEIDLALQALTANGTVTRLKIWNAEHWVVYSDNARLRGRWFAADDALDRALAGETPESFVTDLSRPEELDDQALQQGDQLAVYVPIWMKDGAYVGGPMPDDNDVPTATVVGASEIYIPYAGIADDIRDDKLRLFVALGVSLVVLYLVLFRLVWGASRKLRRQAEENEHQALHDALTGLPNRQMLARELDRMLARRKDEGHVGLTLLDLDRFKDINDTFGHTCGDQLLMSVAQRLRAEMPHALVARLGGDEFVVVVSGLASVDDAESLSADVEALLEAPFPIEGILVSVRASHGVVLAPDHGSTAELLLQRADIAMYVAKRTGNGARRVYSPELDHHSPERLALVAELRDAITAKQIVLVHQPKLHLASGRITSVESLVRWRHPKRGLLPPGEFLPIVETTEWIDPLTWEVLDQALATCASWRASGLELKVAVNVSARTVGSPELVERVRDALARHGVPSSMLELELTESALLEDHQSAVDNLHALRDLGVAVSVDDFGTGYASVGYLTTMPLTALKIDMSFVQGMLVDRSAAAVVDFSLGLAEQLGLEVVAEGVEDDETLEALRARGCTYAQGYVITRPLPAPELVHWLLEWSTRHLPRSTTAAAGTVTTITTPSIVPDDARSLIAPLPVPAPFQPPRTEGAVPR
jgi:diguanylate cyclase (GGDEF)-like protein